MENLIPELKLPGEGTFLDYAAEEMKRKGKIDIEFAEPNQTTMLFVGNSSSGKTTLIQKFFGQVNPIESTFLLDYFPPPKSYTKLNNERPICHFWELGDGVLYEEALIYLTNFPNLSVVICMDLAKPQFLHSTQEQIFRMILKFVENRRDFEEAKKARFTSIPDQHPDAAFLKQFPAPLVIIGCMYDIFNRFEPEQKRIITQFMRYVAHLHGAFLIYSTNRNPEIFKQTKDILKHYAQGTELPTLKKTDYNAAVVIPPYTDTFSDIDPSGSGQHSIEKYRLLLEAHFPQENMPKSVPSENPADNPKYADPVIDLIRKQQQQKKSIFEQWEKKPEEEETEVIKKVVNPFENIKPVEFRTTTDKEEEDVIRHLKAHKLTKPRPAGNESKSEDSQLSPDGI